MMKIKKKIVWKYVLSVNILLLPIAFGVLMIDADSPEKNIQITVRVKDKSCFKASHDLLFKADNKIQQVAVNNSVCDRINIGDSIKVYYCQKYDSYNYDLNKNDDWTKTIWFFAIWLFLQLILIFDFTEMIQKYFYWL